MSCDACIISSMLASSELAQECEHALLLGGSLDLWFGSLRRRLGVGRGGRGLAPSAGARER